MGAPLPSGLLAEGHASPHGPWESVFSLVCVVLQCSQSSLSWKGWSLFEIPFTQWPCNSSLMGSRRVLLL